MFYESLIILIISTLNFSEGVPASVLGCIINISSIVEFQRWWVLKSTGCPISKRFFFKALFIKNAKFMVLLQWTIDILS